GVDLDAQVGAVRAPALQVLTGAFRLAARKGDLDRALVGQLVEGRPVHAAAAAIGAKGPLDAGNFHDMGKVNALVPADEFLHDGRLDAGADNKIGLCHSAKALEVGVAIEGIDESTNALGVELVEHIQELPGGECDRVFHVRVRRHHDSLVERNRV